MPKSTVFTDELSAYDGLDKVTDTLTAGSGVYVMGEVRTTPSGDSGV
jgi:transposase-like protein